jgi:ABC-type Fe3+-hydroxamate transport system substrate-binding protein
MFGKFQDQLGREVKLLHPPQRIVSVVPSQTELLYTLGLDERVVGISKFCIHPNEWFERKSRVGGTKKLNLEKIHALRPDLIIANKEENQEQDIRQLMEHFPVWVSDISTMQEALSMIREVGHITAMQPQAENLVLAIESAFQQLRPFHEMKRVAYLIWKDPLMLAGKNTFIDDLLCSCGMRNIVSNEDGRYPTFTLDELREKEVELLFLSSEPFPFNATHAIALREKLPRTQIELVDGELFSWYGSRLTQAPAYFNALMEQIESTIAK